MTICRPQRSHGGRRTRAAIVSLLFVCSFLAGCGSVPVVGKQSRATAFDNAAATYGKLLRWGYFDEAVAYLRARDGDTVVPDLSLIARHRITSYDIKSQLLADTGREGRVVAVIDYYDVDSGVLQSLRDEQLWWFDDETKRWYLDSPLPPFGRRAQ